MHSINILPFFLNYYIPKHYSELYFIMNTIILSNIKSKLFCIKIWMILNQTKKIFQFKKQVGIYKKFKKLPKKIQKFSFKI